MTEDLKKAKILAYENFHWQVTRLEKILVEAFDENIILEDPEIEGISDLKRYIKNNFGEKF